MKKLIAFILITAIAAIAVVADNTISRKDVSIYMRSGNWNTGDRYSTVPVLVGGKVTCPYVGSIFADPYGDGECPAVNVYHLVRVAETKKGLDCYYDYTVGGDYMFAAYRQEECPDILAAFDGLQFFRGVYFDSLDDYRLYYRDSLLTQTFDGEFESYPVVKRQIRYRRINMRNGRRARSVSFGKRSE